MTDLLDLMRARRSVRRYTAQPVPDALLHQILEAGRWGPSAHNRQPWRFAVLADPARRQALAEAMAARFRVDLAAAGLPAARIDEQVARSQVRIGGAPALIVLFLSMADMDEYPDARRQEAERTMAIQSVALAAQNMLLAAHDAGLGACWVCAPLFCPDVVRDVLALPVDWEAQGLLTIGYPAEVRSKDRALVETKTRWF